MISRRRDLTMSCHASVQHLYPIHLQKCLPNNITSAASPPANSGGFPTFGNKDQQLAMRRWPSTSHQAGHFERNNFAHCVPFSWPRCFSGDQDPGMRTFFHDSETRESQPFTWNCKSQE